jgi:hypothetical protein
MREWYWKDGGYQEALSRITKRPNYAMDSWNMTFNAGIPT